MNSSLKCSIAECKARLIEIDSMDLAQLETYATKCATCGNWILKDDPVANKTYEKVSLRWAEEFNNALISRKD
ncbi:hypothetical protein [Sulfurospirillum oryzae]|uniref:hypothetical protein n=1 Tax=Sulfurospirillum oryzae TaxID=2976535 RepID=UPI0021E7F09C|nr:hypothetical protein [Sulfurospirillum oryzae]